MPAFGRVAERGSPTDLSTRSDCCSSAPLELA